MIYNDLGILPIKERLKWRMLSFAGKMAYINNYQSNDDVSFLPQVKTKPKQSAIVATIKENTQKGTWKHRVNEICSELQLPNPLTDHRWEDILQDNSNLRKRNPQKNNIVWEENKESFKNDSNVKNEDYRNQVQRWSDTTWKFLENHLIKEMKKEEEIKLSKKQKPPIFQIEVNEELKMASYLRLLPQPLSTFFFKIRSKTLPVASRICRDKTNYPLDLRDKQKESFTMEAECPCCSKNEETFEHFLLECEYLKTEREAVIQAISDELKPERCKKQKGKCSFHSKNLTQMASIVQDIGTCNGETTEKGIARIEKLYNMWRVRCKKWTESLARVREQLNKERDDPTDPDLQSYLDDQQKTAIETGIPDTLRANIDFINNATYI
jgi:hypothetical protein